MAKPRVNVKHLHASFEASVKVLQSAAPYAAEFIRRREHEPSDGYPSSSMGGSGGQQGTISNPTLRAALDKPELDETAIAIDTWMRCIGDIDTLCRTMKNAQTQILRIEQEERGRQSTVKVCLACEEPAVTLISGYDRPCYDKWNAWRKKQADAGQDPSPIAFRALIRTQLVKA